MKRPNVIVVLTDQQRWDCAGVQGNPLGLMPNFDRLAQSGMHLRNTFTCQPLCAPARACLQTGRYATAAGVPINGFALPSGAETLAHRFAGAGYRTAYFGKWHLGPADRLGWVPKENRGGYQDWLAANVLELVSDAHDCRLWDAAGREHRLPGYRVDALTDAAIDYVGRTGPEPFFLFLSYLEPHQQNSRDDYPAPEDYADRYRGRWLPPDLARLDAAGRKRLAGYCGMVKRLDEALGRLCTALQRQGLWEDTILLFTSDHGCHFRTRNDEYKRSCHESSIRVPALMHGPGLNGLGDRPELVSLVDLPPTLLDAAGLPIPRAMQGRSFLAHARGGEPWRDEIFVQISESQNARALRDRRWKYCVSAPPGDTVLAREAPHWPRYVETELYDLLEDPWEQNNRVADPALAIVREELRARLLARMAEAREPVVEATPSSLPTRSKVVSVGPDARP